MDGMRERGQCERGAVGSPFAARGDRTTTCNAWCAVLRLMCSICIMDVMREGGKGRGGAVGSPFAARGFARQRVTSGVQYYVECEYMYYECDEGDGLFHQNYP